MLAVEYTFVGPDDQQLRRWPDEQRHADWICTLISPSPGSQASCHRKLMTNLLVDDEEEQLIILFINSNVIFESKAVMEEYERQAKLFKVLMHPARLAILDILRAGEQCVCHMEAFLGFRQAYISQQLMLLREAGLVEDRREGWNIFYRVTNPQIFALMDDAAALTGANAVPALHQRQAGEIACPCPKCNPAAERSALLNVEALGSK